MAKTNKIGDWVVIDELTANTGQAFTYLVHKDGDEQKTPRVLKHMKSDGPFVNRRSRFQQEAAAYQKLSHKNIVRFIDSGEHKGKPFIVTEYCPGGSLSPKILAGKTLLERLALFRGICEGIAYAHSQGVVHRDLKPDNIFLDAAGTPVIGDFGLCFFLDGAASRVTHFQEAVGPRNYMPPECEGGRTLEVAPNGDVYCLGKVLYWMLAGRDMPRELYDDSEYDLRPNQPTTDMDVIYTLFDDMIKVRPYDRMKDGAVALKKLDDVIEQIQTRQRIFELANLPTGKATVNEVRVASFQPGSTVMYDLVDTAGFEPRGFRGSGDKLAIWGIRPAGRQPAELEIAFRPKRNYSWGTHRYQSSGIVSPGGAFGYQALAFNPQGRPSVSFVEVQGESKKLLIASVGSNGGVAATAIAEDVTTLRYGALTYGPGGETAAYCGYDSPLKFNESSETFVTGDAALHRYPTGVPSNFMSPLAFDHTGKLHQAIVVEIAADNRHVRHLVHLSREPSGETKRDLVDSTDGHNGWEQMSDSRMAGQIDLCLDPNGSPVVLANSARASNNHLAVYSLQSGVWSKREIDLVPVVKHFGASSIHTGGWKQLLFDTYLDGQEVKARAHIALSSDEGRLNGVLYIALNDQWEVIDQRFFPAEVMLGMAVDEHETVHLAFR